MTDTPPLVSVVDDDESVRESLPDLLKEFGYRVRAFPSAEDFLASDCVMACQQHKIPIIFITALGEETVRQLLLHGAIACLTKPFSDAALYEALDAALRAR